MRRSLFFYILFVLGLIAIGVGVYIGLTSHQVTYQQVKEGRIAHYLANEQNGYLQMEGSTDLYILYERDFTPQVQGTDTFQNGSVVTFIYTPSETVSINETSVLGTHLEGRASHVMNITQIVNGKRTDFTTNDYSQNPQGFFRNNWPYGGGCSALGLLLIAGSFLIPGASTKKRLTQRGTPDGPPAWQVSPESRQQQPDGPYGFQPQSGQTNAPVWQSGLPPSLSGPQQLRPFATQSGQPSQPGMQSMEQEWPGQQQPQYVLQASQQSLPQYAPQVGQEGQQRQLFPPRTGQFMPRFPSQSGIGAPPPRQDQDQGQQPPSP